MMTDLPCAYANGLLRSSHSGNGVVGGFLVGKSTVTEAHRKVSDRIFPPSCVLTTFTSAYLVSGTPPSTLASQTILTVLSPDSEDYPEPADTLFAKLGLLRSVALKVKESAANERPAISRPAREARDILKNMGASEESLAGIF